MIQTAAKKDEAAKIAQPLTTDEIKTLAQKGGSIFEKLKPLTIQNTISKFLYEKIGITILSSFIKKISGENFFFLQVYADIPDSTDYTTAKHIIIEFNSKLAKNIIFNFTSLFEFTQTCFNRLLVKIDNESKESEEYIFSDKFFLKYLIQKFDQVDFDIVKVYINFILPIIIKHLDTTTLSSSIKELDQIIQQLTSLLTKVSGKNPLLPNSKIRKQREIDTITKMKEDCQVLKLRLENVKAMIEGLKKNFEKNEVVKKYLKPSEDPNNPTSKSSATPVVAFVPTASQYKLTSQPKPSQHSITTYMDLKEKIINLSDQFHSLYVHDKFDKNKIPLINNIYELLYFLYGPSVVDITNPTTELYLKSIIEKLNVLKQQIEIVNVDEQGVVNAETIKELQQQVSTIYNNLYDEDKKYKSNFRSKQIPEISLRKILSNIHYVFNGFSKRTTDGNTTILIDKAKIKGNIKELIEFDPKLEELLKKLYLIFSTIYESLNYPGGSLSAVLFELNNSIANFAKSHNKEQKSADNKKILNLIQQAITNISNLDNFNKEIKIIIGDLKKVLLMYKNAFITLSFQIASTLFGYGISFLQIFMQNFPEQMNNFNQDMLQPSKPNYGLQELDKLKTPFKTFVNEEDVENQDFELSDYALDLLPYSTDFGKTPFNLLLPLDDKLSSVPLFYFNTMCKALDIPERTSDTFLIGGSKPRILLRHQHHSNSPSQQKKRPKKRKTIKHKLNSVKKTSNKKKTIKKSNKKRRI